MKRILSIALICAMALMVSCFAVSADGPTITVPNVTAKPGDTLVTLEVTISGGLDSSSDTFSDVCLEFGYNSDVFTMSDDAEYGLYISDAAYGTGRNKKALAANTSQTIDTNPYVVNWSSPANAAYFDVATNGDVIVYLVFDVDANAPAGVYPITVDYYKGIAGDYVDGTSCNFDMDRNSLGLNYVNGSITIEGDTPTTNTITVSAAGKSAVFETEEAISGTVLVGLYDGNRLIEVYTYDAAAEIAPVFTADTAGKTIKALWWENLTTVKPLSAAKVLE